MRHKYIYTYQDRKMKNCVDTALEDVFAIGDFDMRIAVDGEIIGVHRLVLIMFSSLLRNVLSKTPTDNVVLPSKYRLKLTIFSTFLSMFLLLDIFKFYFSELFHYFWSIFLFFSHITGIFIKINQKNTVLDTSPRHMKQIIEMFYRGRVTIEREDRERFERIMKAWRINGVYRKVLTEPIKPEPTMENNENQNNVLTTSSMARNGNGCNGNSSSSNSLNGAGSIGNGPMA